MLNNKIPATNTSDTLCFATRIGFGFANFVATKTIKMIVSKNIVDHMRVAMQKYYHLNLQSYSFVLMSGT